MTPKQTPVVLVADDEEEMRAMLEQFVSSQGYVVHTAANGDEAWEKVQKHRPDLVLLDVRMPGLSGWEVSRNISHDPGLKHIKVIVITGIGERVNEMTSPLFGAFAYLDKPFDISDLESKIHAALGDRARATSNGVAGAAAPAQGGFAPPRRKAAKPAAKTPAAKPAAKKPAAKPATQKAAAKPAAKKPATKKPAAKKPAAKKPAAKPATKPAAKKPAPAAKNAAKSAKPAAKKPSAAVKPAAKKPATKPATKPAGKKPAGKKP